MAEYIKKTSVLAVLSFLLFSCSSSAPASYEPAPDSSGESGVLYYAPPRGNSQRSQRPENVSEDRMITYSVMLTLSVKNPEETKKILLEQVKENDGFIVREDEHSITTRIPSENMDNFIIKAKTLGKIENESKRGTDITDQYRDNVIRLDNLKNVRARYLALLERANTVSDILSIEKELERVNTEIEVLEGRIKHAQQSVAYSSITVNFREKTRPGIVGWVFVGLYRGIKWLFVWN